MDEGESTQKLKNEIDLIINNISVISNELGIYRLLNGLEAIRIAQLTAHRDVYIG